MTPQTQIRVAVVDSDSGFERVLTRRMNATGWDHRVLGTVAPAQDLLEMKLHAIVIDPQVVGERFWEYLETTAQALPSVGIVVCAFGSTVAQRVKGLRLGADDWIAKPAHPEEVIARVEAVVRRYRRERGVADVGPLVVADVEIRPDRFQAFVHGRSLDLTRREYELLNVLAGAEGGVIERADIYERVWGYSMARGDRSVDVFVRKLRQKLARHSPDWEYIHTQFGVGYRLEPVSLRGDADAVEPVDARSHPVHSAATTVR